MIEWTLDAQNTITFVMVDANGTEVTGLGSGFTLQISKNGGAFNASAGTKAEIGNGWYSYVSTAGEADTAGPVSIRVSGAGAVQQNLAYLVEAALPTAAQINAEIVDALATDTYAEPGQGAPPATASLAAKIGYLFKVLRNKLTQTSSTLSVYNDAGDTVDHKATVADDGTTYTRGELGTGP